MLYINLELISIFIHPYTTSLYLVDTSLCVTQGLLFLTNLYGWWYLLLHFVLMCRNIFTYYVSIRFSKPILLCLALLVSPWRILVQHLLFQSSDNPNIHPIVPILDSWVSFILNFLIPPWGPWWLFEGYSGCPLCYIAWFFHISSSLPYFFSFLKIYFGTDRFFSSLQPSCWCYGFSPCHINQRYWSLVRPFSGYQFNSWCSYVSGKVLLGWYILEIITIFVV